MECAEDLFRGSLNPERKPDPLYSNEVLAIMLHLGNGIVNIREGLMPGLLHQPCKHFRFPALRQFFQSTHVKVAIMKVSFQPRHPSPQEAPVLANGIAAHGRYAWRDMLLQKRNHGCFNLGLHKPGRSDLFYQAGSRVSGSIPTVHPVDYSVWLEYHQYRSFRYHVQECISHYESDFNDTVVLRAEATPL